ncbi:MAG: hypothetical protein ACQKBU_05845, partial [Verrucomicrobiales bacterium]
MKNKLLSLAVLTAATSFASGQTTYTWTGTAADGDWTNPANWDVNGVPVDDVPDTGGNTDGLSLPDEDQIIFSGTSMPTVNLPTYGGVYDGGANAGANSSPALVLNSGGDLSFTHVGHDDSFWTNRNQPDVARRVLTIGDGIGGGTEDVTLTLSGTLRMNRHGNGQHEFLVNSDGTLIMNSNLNRWGHAASRPAFVQIDGGTVIFNDDIPDVNFNNGAVEFLSTGGTFTANYGGKFPDATTVSTALGINFVNSSDGILTVTDNGGASF